MKLHILSTFLSRRFSAFVHTLRKVGAAAGLLGSVAVAAGAVAGSFYVPTKGLGVFVAAAGCFVAGFLFAVFFAKSLKLAEKERETNESLRAALEKQTAESAGLRGEVAQLRLEADRLRGQRIDINGFRPILKLGLAEADMSIKDVKIAWLNDFKHGTVSSSTRSQYVGVLEKKFKATFGVDMAKIRIRDENGVLRVAGLSTENIGFRDDVEKWLVCPTQRCHLKGRSLVNGEAFTPDPARGFVVPTGERYYEIDPQKGFDGTFDRNRTDAAATMQRADLQARVNNGVGAEFAMVNRYIRDMAQEFLRLLLAPAKKPLVFDDAPLAALPEASDASEWLSVEDFAQNFNKRLEAPTT